MSNFNYLTNLQTYKLTSRVLKTVIFMLMLQMTLTGQTPEQRAFTMRMENHIDASLSDAAKMKQVKEKYATSCDADHVLTDEDIRTLAADAEKHAFKRMHIKEYMKAFFPEEESMVLADTLICDNGGFEEDFKYYRGYSAEFKIGSNTCIPQDGGVPSVFVQQILPTVREFEIVSPGIDPITGIQKVKFGNKSLKLNDPYSHLDGGCEGDFGINRLVKRFKVTEANRDITVWYTLAIENPPGHSNQQPYLSIKCDLAPYSDLCFDAAILDCDSTYSQPGCTYPEVMDVLDWTCHRIKIPSTEIGKIATLEITVSDCGQGGHNGYAYIDGICEACTGSALGSITLHEQSPMVSGLGIDYISCGADVARICGSYTEPYICGEWYLDSIALMIPGYTITNISIDTINKVFCFDFPKSNLMGLTAEIYVGGFFKRKGGGILPVVFSNTILIEKKLFKEKYDIYVMAGPCNDNGTDDFLSDDYYTVRVVFDPGIEGWSITKQLLDPYPNESGYQYLEDGTSFAALNLGPFLIQEGSWEMTVTIGDCVYKFIIDPPMYCSGCSKFHNLKIFDIECDNTTTPNTWKFKINVPGDVNDVYKLTSSSSSSSLQTFNYGMPAEIEAGVINTSCITYTLIDDNDNLCIVTFTVCPPKPCDDNIDCDLDISFRKVQCTESGFNVELDMGSATSLDLCYVISPPSPGANYYGGGVFGPFDEHVTIIIYSCPGSISCEDCERDKECFKVIKVYKPDCSNQPIGRGEAYSGSTDLQQIKNISEVSIIPNPGQSEVKIISAMRETKLVVFDINGRITDRIEFDGKEYKWDISTLSPGTFIIRYLDESGEVQTIKFVKI